MGREHNRRTTAKTNKLKPHIETPKGRGKGQRAKARPPPFYKNQNKMKEYNVIIETGEMIVSDFIIEAENLKEAKRIAQSHKRLERLKGRTRVKRIK